MALKMRTKKQKQHRVNRHVACDLPVSLIEHVREKRTALKLTQHALGKLLGYEKSSVSRWELEKMPAVGEARRKLVEWLGFDPDISPT